MYIQSWVNNQIFSLIIKDKILVTYRPHNLEIGVQPYMYNHYIDSGKV